MRCSRYENVDGMNVKLNSEPVEEVDCCNYLKLMRQQMRISKLCCTENERVAYGEEGSVEWCAGNNRISSKCEEISLLREYL